MVKHGDADAFVAGMTSHYPDVIRPALHVFQTKPGVSRVAGMYVMSVRDNTYFFTDATVNINPTAEELADIAILAADTVSRFGIEPRIAMLSFSNFGSAEHPRSRKVREAVEIVHRRRPALHIDGEMQADTAVVPEMLEDYPFSQLVGSANVLVFPSLEAANIAYKLLARLGEAEAMGPILMGLNRPSTSCSGATTWRISSTSAPWPSSTRRKSKRSSRTARAAGAKGGRVAARPALFVVQPPAPTSSDRRSTAVNKSAVAATSPKSTISAGVCR